MPRITPVPPEEREICRRLRVFRQHTKLSQVAFAKALEIDSSKLASHEHGRVPIRFALAFMAYIKFDLNLPWLATGEGEMAQPGLLLPQDLRALGITDRKLFSEAYKILQPEITRAGDMLKRLHSPAHVDSLLGQLDTPLLVSSLGLGIERQARELPAELHPTFIKTIAGAYRAFLVGQRQNIRHRLTSDSDDVERPQAMRQTLITSWDELKERVQSLTNARGARAALARRMKVTPQAVSEWMLNKSSPSADVTIRLLDWVAKGGPLTNDRGDALTPPRSKTLKGLQSESKDQSGRSPRSQKRR